MSSDFKLQPYPEFEYVDSIDYENNYYKWKDMSDYEAKSDNRVPYSDKEGRSVFRKMWGYKALTGINKQAIG